MSNSRKRRGSAALLSYMKYARPRHNPVDEGSLLAYFIFYTTRRRRTPAFLVHVHMCISGRDVQKVIPFVVVLAVRTNHGGESFVGVVHLQRYEYILI